MLLFGQFRNKLVCREEIAQSVDIKWTIFYFAIEELMMLNLQNRAEARLLAVCLFDHYLSCS